MRKKDVRALLTVTVITVPLVFATGCGKKTDNTAVEPTVQAEITETVATPTEAIEDAVKETMPEVTFAPVEETLDESELYVGDMYAIGEVSVYAEPSEDAEVIGTLSDGEKVSVLGILHEAEFYKVSTDTLEGYVRTVDLEDENGLYDEETNTDTEENSGEQKTSNSQTSSSNAGGLSDEELQSILNQYGFGDPSYIYNPANDGDYTFGESGASDGSVVGHIQ